MSIEMMIYLANVIPGVGVLCFILAIIAIAIAVVISLIYWDNGDETPVKVKHLLLIVLLTLVSIGVPSERTIWMMAGASVGKDLIASETGVKVQKLLNSKLDELISEGEKK